MSQGQKQFGVLEYTRSILSMLFFFLMLVIFTPIILLGLLLTFGKFSNFVVEKIAPLVARATLVINGIQFKIENHTGPKVPFPAVFVINHSSTLDMLTVLALGLPRVRFVAKWQFQYNPIFLILGRLTGQVFIRREQSEKAIQTLQKNVKRIHRQKLSVLMAPEGSRKHPGIIGPFKKGPFRMAMDLQYPIVPIYLEGNRELSTGAFLVTKPGLCKAHIHPPIDTSGWKFDTLEKHISEVRSLYLNWAGVDEQSNHLPG
ncbi:MAG: 1-acyl-sn-glycerol-3-phosphate acyltransferase [Balneolaceae bacterium]|nr:MAG: 1-acyl-sn-glycerol-3-phosphate acyltransferase [Balneolaceae bacterium]